MSKKVMWSDEVYATLHNIPKVTQHKNKALPFEAKLKLPVVEAIASFYLAKEEHK